MRNALAYAGKSQPGIVAAWIGTAFAQDDAAAGQNRRVDRAPGQFLHARDQAIGVGGPGVERLPARKASSRCVSAAAADAPWAAAT